MPSKLSTLIDVVLEEYLKDCVSLDLTSVAGRLDEASTSCCDSGTKICKCMEVSSRWAWLFAHCTPDQVRLLLNDTKAKIFRQQYVLAGKGKLPDTGALKPVSQRELAKREGLSLRQYERRLTCARTAIMHALSSRDRERRAA